MLSKFVRPWRAGLPLVRAGPPPAPPAGPTVVPWRAIFGLIPPSQYDIPFPKKLQLGYAMRVHWEIIPVIFVTVFTLSLTTMAILWACAHKVDVSFGVHNEKGTISRTMDLRNPESHKIIMINQRYPPWPEMQAVLDKMTLAEKRALVRMQSCSLP